jgi:hypothetical protein
MKIITRYIADDGREFNSGTDCKQYEDECEEVNKIMNRLKPVPDDIGFVNGMGYRKQEPFEVRHVTEKLIQLAAKKFNRPELASSHISHAHRVADDADHKTLCRALNRLQCIDNQSREWGQQYFARNPEKGTQAEI